MKNVDIMQIRDAAALLESALDSVGLRLDRLQELTGNAGDSGLPVFYQVDDLNGDFVELRQKASDVLEAVEVGIHTEYRARVLDETRKIIQELGMVEFHPDDDGLAASRWIEKHLGVKPETAAAIMEDLPQ